MEKIFCFVLFCFFSGMIGCTSIQCGSIKMNAATGGNLVAFEKTPDGTIRYASNVKTPEYWQFLGITIKQIADSALAYYTGGGSTILNKDAYVKIPSDLINNP